MTHADLWTAIRKLQKEVSFLRARGIATDYSGAGETYAVYREWKKRDTVSGMEVDAPTEEDMDSEAVAPTTAERETEESPNLQRLPRQKKQRRSLRETVGREKAAMAQLQESVLARRRKHGEMKETFARTLRRNLRPG
ncbi:MAG: uncharacterized protein A8A55_2847 [Amphiamblys sp. WSBS2006]|nr:MAG: uncharacterized protein A8A55_2847 [Amphiamblys sp. WSBS2006]